MCFNCDFTVVVRVYIRSAMKLLWHWRAAGVFNVTGSAGVLRDLPVASLAASGVAAQCGAACGAVKNPV